MEFPSSNGLMLSKPLIINIAVVIGSMAEESIHSMSLASSLRMFSCGHGVNDLSFGADIASVVLR